MFLNSFLLFPTSVYIDIPNDISYCHSPILDPMAEITNQSRDFPTKPSFGFRILLNPVHQAAILPFAILCCFSLLM